MKMRIAASTLVLLLVIPVSIAQRQTGTRNGTTRIQRRIPDNYSFPCKTNRSKEKASSVHRLRPEDIGVIGAVGDSMLAGNGALGSVFPFSNMLEHTGVSFGMGGAKTWREYLTVPNILKLYNPHLQGYSDRSIPTFSNTVRLNVAKSVMSDADALMEAKILVKRMKENPNIDFYNDWKIVTLMIGNNNLCSLICWSIKRNSPRQHQNHMKETLDYLQKNLPRTFVNLIPVMDVTVIKRYRPNGITCHFAHQSMCLCSLFFNDLTARVAKQYQQMEKELVASGRYDNDDNFTVVLQPFIMFLNSKTPIKELPDFSYVTPDCMHFNQKGHAIAAQALWNNMLEPVGRKSVNVSASIFPNLKCPSENAPYFFTSQNSKLYLETGRQW